MKRLVFILITCSLFGAKAEDSKTSNISPKKIDLPTVKCCPNCDDPCRPVKGKNGTDWKTGNENEKLRTDNKTLGAERDLKKESGKRVMVQSQGGQ